MHLLRRDHPTGLRWQPLLFNQYLRARVSPKSEAASVATYEEQKFRTTGSKNSEAHMEVVYGDSVTCNNATNLDPSITLILNFALPLQYTFNDSDRPMPLVSLLVYPCHHATTPTTRLRTNVSEPCFRPVR